MNLMLIFLVMFTTQNDYAAQYAFQKPVMNQDLTYYEQMKQFESLK